MQPENKFLKFFAILLEIMLVQLPHLIMKSSKRWVVFGNVSSTSETIGQLHFPIFLIIFVTSSGTCISPWLVMFYLFADSQQSVPKWHVAPNGNGSSYLRMIRRMCYQPLATMSFSLDTRRVESSLSFTNISLKMIFFFIAFQKKFTI